MAKRGGGVSRRRGSLPRDVAAAVVFSSARGGAAAARASDEAFAEILAGEPWQMRVDVPGGPLAAEAGVPRDERTTTTTVMSGPGTRTGTGTSYRERNPVGTRGDPSSPTCASRGSPRTRWWRYNPSSSTATGPAFPRRTETTLRAQTRTRARSGTGTRGGSRARTDRARGVRGASRCTAPVGSVARTSPSHRVKWTRCPWGGRFRRYRLR